MRPEPSHRIDPRAIRLWQIHGLVQLVLLTVMVASVLGTLLLSSTLPEPAWMRGFLPSLPPGKQRESSMSRVTVLP